MILLTLSPFKEISVKDEHTENELIRLSIPIDRETNELFSSIMPHGLKAEVIRCLVLLVIDSQKELGKGSYLIHHLINKECKLVIKET